MSNKIRNSQNPDNYKDLIKHINSLPTAEIANKLNLNLKLIGNSYQGNCPTGHFSQSGHCFSINSVDNYFQCFSCGIGGDNIELVKVSLHFSFMEAVKWIVKQFNINYSFPFTQEIIKETTPEELKKEQEFKLKAHLYEQVYEWGHQLLFIDRASAELSYLTRDRGYSIDNLKIMGFCYFPKQEEIRSYLLSIYPEAGKLIRSLPLNGYYGDNFRLALPYRNRAGEITGFLKRASTAAGIEVTTRDGKKHIGVRWDSTFGLNKRDLFNLNKIEKKDSILIVEGYPDAENLYSLGLDNIVAVGQGKLSRTHIEGAEEKRIKTAILAFDNDKVGPDNTMKAVELLLKESQIIPFVLDPSLLGEYKDPDEYVKGRGIENFKELFLKSVRGTNWLIDKIIKESGQSDLLKEEAKQRLLNLSILLRNPEDRSLLIDKLCAFLSLGKVETKNLIKQYRSEHRKKYFNNNQDGFWLFNENDKGETEISINMKDYVDFISGQSFGKYYLGKEYVFVNHKDNIVQEYSLPQIKDHIINYIDNQDESKVPYKSMIFEELYGNVGRYFNESLIECIPAKKIIFKRDKADKAFVYYRNGFVTLSKGENKTFNTYDSLDNPIWKECIIDRDYQPLSEKFQRSEFEQFVRNISGNDQKRFDAICSAIGYLIHDYKDRSNAKAIVLCDEKLSDSGSANGRTGKSLVGKAVSYLRNMVRIDARNFTFEDRFTFQAVNLDTKVLDFNDAEGGFQFDKLFSVVTDDMSVQYKNKRTFSIPFEQSPKILISTNYTIKGTGISYTDRLFEIEFADYYTDKFKPIDEFRHRFFDDWDETEWLRFDTFMLDCLQLYLDKGLIKSDEINLSKRKLIDSTSAEFVDFAEDNLSVNEEYNLNQLYQSFKAHSGYRDDIFDKCPTKQNTFTKWLPIYAEYNNYEFSKRQSNGIQKVSFTVKK